MLDIEKIRQLIEMMVANDLVEVSLRDGSEEVNLRRPGDTVAGQIAVPAAAAPSPVAASEGQPRVEAQAEEDEDADLVMVDSPMVGTFYTAADPESPPYVKVGSSIGPGTVLCIVEAMKVFNEIKSEISGVIERILVSNEQAVEYGQPMFAVRPA